MLKNCVVCGGPFNEPPSSHSKTCGRECSIKHRSVVTRKRNRAMKIVPGPAAMKAASEATRASPHVGHFESNIRAKLWRLKHRSTGTVIEVQNLMLFAEKNMDLFPGTETPLNVVRGLSQVAACMLGRAHSRAQSYRGWEVVSVHLPDQTNA